MLSDFLVTVIFQII